MRAGEGQREEQHLLQEGTGAPGGLHVAAFFIEYGHDGKTSLVGLHL